MLLRGKDPRELTLAGSWVPQPVALTVLIGSILNNGHEHDGKQLL